MTNPSNNHTEQGDHPMRTLLLSFTFLFLSANPSHAIDPVSLVLEAPSSAKLVAEYLGLIESIESKIDRLIDADQKTGVSLFEQAKTNTSKSEELIREARVSFTRAAAIQEGSMAESARHKRAIALLGLWCCCKAQDDIPNAKLALEKIVEISDEPSSGLRLRGKRSSPFAFSKAFLIVSFALSSPSKEHLRTISPDYDSLLKMQDRTRKHLASMKNKKAEQVRL